MTEAEIIRKRVENLDNRKEERVPDSLYGYMFRESTMRECPHPGIRKKYGSYTGHCWVSPMTCRAKCRYAVTYPMHAGISCGYEKERKQHEQSGKADQGSAE